MTDESEQQAAAEDHAAIENDAPENDDALDNPDGSDDEEELEWEDGRKFIVPKTAKAAIEAGRDAERIRAEVEAAKEAFNTTSRQREDALAKQAADHARQVELQRQFSADLADVRATDKLIAQWRAFDPRTQQEVDERRDALDRLKDERETLGQELGARMNQAQHDAATQAQQSESLALTEFNERLNKIDGWSPKVSQEVFAHATKSGWTQAELAAIRDVRAVDTLRKAYLHDQHTAKQSAAKTVQAQQATAPAPQVGGKRAPPTGLDDRQSDDEWVRRRNEQLRKRGR